MYFKFYICALYLHNGLLQTAAQQCSFPSFLTTDYHSCYFSKYRICRMFSIYTYPIMCLCLGLYLAVKL